tara:strand:- start:417 stop:530 length:114 start_codon:yes stop_codon:yes gene_type:complete
VVVAVEEIPDKQAKLVVQVEAQVEIQVYVEEQEILPQ